MRLTNGTLPWPWIDPENFNPGYMMRNMHLLPKRGDKPEWQHSQDYWAEKDEIPAIDLDGVICTHRLPERIDQAVMFLEKGVPTYTSKPAATSLAQLEKITSAVRRTGTPWFSTSVLRYAPAVLGLKAYLDKGKAGTLIQVRATSCHYISHYMEEPGIWQDDPRRGGDDGAWRRSCSSGWSPDSSRPSPRACSRCCRSC